MVKRLPTEPRRLEYEKVDVNPRSITRAGLILAGMTLVAATTAFGVFELLAARGRRLDPPPPPMARHDPDRRPPAPRLQDAPLADVEALRSEEAAVLDGYGWVDQGAGIARVPIEEAMRMYVARSTAKGTANDTTETQPTERKGHSNGGGAVFDDSTAPPPYAGEGSGGGVDERARRPPAGGLRAGWPP